MMIRQQAGATVATTDNSNTPLSHTSQATSDLEIFSFWFLGTFSSVTMEGGEDDGTHLQQVQVHKK